MIIGIDFGATTTDFILWRNGKLLKSKSFPKTKISKAESLFKKFQVNFSKVKAIAVTGGKSKFLKKNLLDIPTYYVNEINAIGFGALEVSKLKKALVVSMGTGTCIVFAGKKMIHLGGTGVGGGTLLGLSKLVLKTNNLKKIEKFALKGNLKKVDLSVKEVVGSGVGIVPGKATASNFGKAKGMGRADAVAGIFNLVAEVVAVCSVFVARSLKLKKVVFIGKTSELKLIQKNLKKVADFYKISFIFPQNRGIATAIGAAKFLSKKVLA